MSEPTNADYVNPCWMRGRLPRRLHSAIHHRKFGWQRAWWLAKVINSPCYLTHADMKWGQKIAREAGLHNGRDADE
jgi:hypothetical protein